MENNVKCHQQHELYDTSVKVVSIGKQYRN